VKEKRVYIKEYAEKGLERYNKLVGEIKDNSLTYLIPNNGSTPKIGYFTFDGNILTNISFALPKFTTKSGYKYFPEITIENFSEDETAISSIEKILLDEGFKKEIKDGN
jgi:hypothetical protein